MSRPDIIALRGNHEEMFLDAHDDWRASEGFRINGGLATLRSFGIDPEEPQAEAQVPKPYIAWMRHLPYWYEDDLRIFVHAGIDPTVPDMNQQNTMMLVWRREPFLSMTEPFFKHVVHGHTPRDNGYPDLRPNRTNLDTGSFFTGVLTCGVFDDTQAGPIDTIQVRPAFNTVR
jgi:serine/threonine protein phosphatase 1